MEKIPLSVAIANPSICLIEVGITLFFPMVNGHESLSNAINSALILLKRMHELINDNRGENLMRRHSIELE